MGIETKFSEKEGEIKRDETLNLNLIDVEYLEQRIREDLTDFEDVHADFFEQRREWMLSLRDLKYRYKHGFFEDSADLHVPYALTRSKAMHARIFQVFSQRNFFSTEANNAVFQESEETIDFYMNWVLNKWVNRGEGKSEVMDRWLQNIIDEGSGVVKLWWDAWEHNFVDLDVDVEETPDLNVFAGQEVEIEETERVKAKVGNVKKRVEESAPAIGTIELDDFYMPPGPWTVQSAPFVAHRVRLEDSELKLRVKQGRFDKEIVQEALDRRHAEGDRHNNLKHDISEMEGLSDHNHQKKFSESKHSIIEWYGRAFVGKNVGDDDFEDMKTRTEEIVVWYHQGIRKVLGWTYLHRISPSGRRPFYKADFMPSKERAIGIGVAELLFGMNKYIDGVHNLKFDNGVLSSTPFGVYRSGSTFKPDTFRIQPGDIIPVEDTNDIKMQTIPYMPQFAESEEATLNGYGDTLLAINDINLGNFGGKGVAGALRNATGANFVDRQANIQLHPHLDRIARTMKFLLSDLFILTRSRMKKELFFRVTGEDGKGFFGNVKKEDLRGDYDFVIDIELAAASESEKQQRVSLMLQTILNPTFAQFGITQPGNLYELLKEFLIRHQIRNPDRFITKPQGHTGPPLSSEQRIMKIMLNRFDTPPVETTVRPEEDHGRALTTLEEFSESELFGNFDQDQVAAFQAVREVHTNFLQAISGAQGVPNIAGTQFSNTGGLPALGGGAEAGQSPDGSEGGPLGSPLGEVNGPVQ